MKVLLASDVHILICGNRLYMPVQVFHIIKRYYDAFGPIIYCGRSERIDSPSVTDIEVSEQISDLIEMNSLSKIILGAKDRKIKEGIQQADLVIARTGSFIAFRAATCARALGKPYLAEVMSCAWDGMWNHSLKGKILAPYMFLKMRSVLKHANYAVYVTSEFLQNRYPCKCSSIAASNVKIDKIDPAVLINRLEKIQKLSSNEITVMTTAALDVRYKGQEYVIRAIPQINKAGFRVKYVLVGGGKTDYLLSVAKECGVEDQLEFTGRLNLEGVFSKLDEADIYIQPSLQEGLPRSVIEAMSRGCPAIGARTAGIPELIAPECVVRRKSSEDIANVILKIWNEQKLTEIAQMNFNKAEEFLDDTLNMRRNEYYKNIKMDILGE